MHACMHAGKDRALAAGGCWQSIRKLWYRSKNGIKLLFFCYMIRYELSYSDQASSKLSIVVVVVEEMRLLLHMYTTTIDRHSKFKDSAFKR